MDITISLLREVGSAWSVIDRKIEDVIGDPVQAAREHVAEHFPGWKIISIQAFIEMEALERYAELDEEV